MKSHIKKKTAVLLLASGCAVLMPGCSRQEEVPETVPEFKEYVSEDGTKMMIR